MSKGITKQEIAAAPVPEVNIQSAILKIVERTDIDPERLEKFLDLQFKMQARQASVEFSNSLAGFQGDCPIIAKTKKVDFTSKTGNQTKYNYSPLDEIVHIIKPHLKNWGLSYSFNIKKTSKEGENELLTTIRHSAGHAEVTSYYFIAQHDDTRMNQSQRSKSAITYAKRAALENALGIVTAEEDDDANRALDIEVGESQIAEIRELIAQTKTDEKKFLDFLRVDNLEKLTAFEAKKAVHALKQKRSR